MSLESSLWKKSLANLFFYTTVPAIEVFKVLYIGTCSCQGQPFNSWFFPAFHQAPWTLYWTYHGITWLAGPYSVFWWILDSPAYFGFWPFFSYLLIVDFGVFYWLHWKHRGYALYWLVLTVWFTTIDPVDFFPILFAVIGRYGLRYLVLSPIIKLPVGAPLSVWDWVLTSSDSLKGPENYGRYLILGTVWTASLLFYLYPRIHLRLSANHIDRLDGTVEDSRQSALQQYSDEPSRPLRYMVSAGQRATCKLLWYWSLALGRPLWNTLVLDQPFPDIERRASLYCCPVSR